MVRKEMKVKQEVNMREEVRGKKGKGKNRRKRKGEDEKLRTGNGEEALARRVSGLSASSALLCSVLFVSPSISLS
jgi:hypothetical protein